MPDVISLNTSATIGYFIFMCLYVTFGLPSLHVKYHRVLLHNVCTMQSLGIGDQKCLKCLFLGNVL